MDSRNIRLIPLESRRVAPGGKTHRPRYADSDNQQSWELRSKHYVWFEFAVAVVVIIACIIISN